MNQLAADDLKELFKKLIKASQLNHDQKMVDELARVSLMILRLLINDQRIASIIARPLSLVIDSTRALPDQPEELFASIAALEEGLESHLRGFSSMLSFVLEEVSIRKDPEVVLLEINNLPPHLRKPFIELANSLIAFLDLDEAFSLEADISAAALFLLGLKDILSCFVPDSGLLLEQWLNQRVKKCPLEHLYHQALLTSPRLADMSREHIVVFLCLKIAEGGRVGHGEKSQLDQVLKSVGMMGVGPLVDGGLLVVEDDSPKGRLEIRLVK